MGSIKHFRILFRAGVRTASLLYRTYIYIRSFLYLHIMAASQPKVEGCTFKAPAPTPPNTLRTKFVDIAESTHSRCEELGRMTSPDVMKASARAKAKSKGTNIALDVCADVPHDAIIEGDCPSTQWLNRYSSTSLRWPMFDMTALLSWVLGLPMVVPEESSGFRFCGSLVR